MIDGRRSWAWLIGWTCCACQSVAGDGRAGLAPSLSARVETAVSCRELGRSLAPLQRHFEAGGERPRMVALLDPASDGLLAVRSVIERLGAGGVQVALVWSEPPRTGAWATALPTDGSVAAFVDRRGAAARTFARGLIVTSRARELYLSYDAGTRWVESEDGGDMLPPRPLDWWHRMGALAPGHFVADAADLAVRLAASLD